MSAPRIVGHNWGSISVSFRGTTVTFKDCILTPQSATEWDWNSDGTRHQPGITIRAVQQLLDCDHIVLSRGRQMVLNVMPDTIQLLQNQGKQIYILRTQEAIDQYNMLVQHGVRVGGLFHSTC